MKLLTTSAVVRLSLLAALSVSTSACVNWDELGQPPAHAPIDSLIGSQDPNFVVTPQPEARPGDEIVQANSLWHPGSRAFFRDQRASRVGDILTINIDIADNANMKNETTTDRSGGQTLGVPNLFGFESSAGNFFGSTFDSSKLVGINSTGNNSGKGEIKRNETINLKVAAIITQKLPNGNLVVKGNQEVLVNAEMRQLDIGGIIRPEDIGSDNTISYEKIAQARISYGGRGTSSDVQQPHYGTQILNQISPF